VSWLKDLLRATTSSSIPEVEEDGNSVRMIFEEDRFYSWEGLREGLRDSLRGFKLEDILDLVDGRVRDLLSTYSELLEKTLGVEFHDFVRPRLSSDGFNFGELVGVYSLGRLNGKEVLLEVCPKVGWEAYERMVKEALETPVILGSRGVLKPLLSSLTYQALHSPLSYSLLLLDLTHEVLTSPLPRRVEEFKVVSEDSIGKLVNHDTYVLMSKGYPLGVFLRFRVGAAYAPLMLLARFHERVIGDLEMLKEAISERYQVSPKVIEGLLEEIDRLILNHRVILWTTPLREHYLTLLRLRPSDSQLINEAYRQAGFNILLKSIVELYNNYISKTSLLHEFIGGRSKLNPVASSKVYELWVLSKILNHLRTFRSGRFVSEEVRDLYLTVSIDGVRIHYNKGREAELLTTILGERVELRPDFIIESDNGCVVLDAKYKREIERTDIERLLTYIIEYARPINRKLQGALITLIDTKAGSYKAIRNKELGIKIEIRIHRLDPRQNKKEIVETIKEITNIPTI
jgi:hypothetical protein